MDPTAAAGRDPGRRQDTTDEHRRPTMTSTTDTSRPRTAPADAGMATAEYAIATLAACGFAALLLAVLSSGEVRQMLLDLVQRALSLV